MVRVQLQSSEHTGPKTPYRICYAIHGFSLAFTRILKAQHNRESNTNLVHTNNEFRYKTRPKIIAAN
jgi:hypothetical protein